MQELWDNQLLTLRPTTRQGCVEHIVQELAVALREQAFYGTDHPAFTHTLEEIAEALCLLLEEEREFRLGVGNGMICANGEPVRWASNCGAALMGACARREVRELVFRGSVAAGEVATLVDLLCEDPGKLEDEGGLGSALARRGVEHIMCELRSDSRAGESGPSQIEARIWRTYTSALDVLQESTRQARVGELLNAGAAQAIAGELADNMIENQAKLLGLLSVKSYDEYTFRHSLNICVLVLALGLAVGLDRRHLRELGFAALLHDVGKAWVPLEVLRKPGRLTEEEFALVKRHPVEGAIYLGQQEHVPPVVPVVAFQHHLGYDQRGYPRPRRPQTPNAYSLMVGIADAYDALTSERPYRRMLRPQQALRVMLSTPSGQFEPRMLAVFAKMVAGSWTKTGQSQ